VTKFRKYWEIRTLFGALLAFMITDFGRGDWILGGVTAVVVATAFPAWYKAVNA
jgi:hypothetical protein